MLEVGNCCNVLENITHERFDRIMRSSYWKSCEIDIHFRSKFRGVRHHDFIERVRSLVWSRISRFAWRNLSDIRSISSRILFAHVIAPRFEHELMFFSDAGVRMFD